MPGGRPRKADNRGRVISIRLTQVEFGLVAAYAHDDKKSLSEYVRSSCWEAPTPAPLQRLLRGNRPGSDRRQELRNSRHSHQT